MTLTAQPLGRAATASVRSVNATLAAALVTVVAFVLPFDPLTQAVCIVGPVALLGAASTCWMSTGLRLAQRLAIALGVGVLATIVVGAVTGFVLPRLGDPAPLSGVAIAWVLCGLSVGVAACSVAFKRDPVRQVCEGAQLRHWLWAGALGVPPLVALLGVARLNASGSTAPALMAAFFALGMVALSIALPERTWGPPRVLLLMSAIVTAGWQTPLRGGLVLGGDLTHEYFIASLAVKQGAFPLHHFVDPYGLMLSLTVWPAVVHGVTGLSLRMILGLLPSLVLAGCVLVIWGAVLDRVRPRVAAGICAVFVVATPGMVNPLPGVSRQCYALLFLSMLIFAITSSGLRARHARMLAVASGVGVALTHYSSGFIVLGVVIAGWLATILFRTPRPERVMTLPVVGAIGAAVVLWDIDLAKAGANVSEVVVGVTTNTVPAHVATQTTLFGPSDGTVITLLFIAVLPLLVFVGATRRSASRRGDPWAVVLAVAALGATLAVVAAAVTRWPRARQWLSSGAHSVTSWVHAASPTSHVPARTLRAYDLQTLAHQDSWMQIGALARATRLVNDPPLTAAGTRVVGPVVSLIQAVGGKAIVLAAAASVAICIVAAVRNPRVSALAGVGAIAFVVSAVWRDSQAIARYFGSVRIQAETYIIFALTVSVAVAWLQDRYGTRWRSTALLRSRTAGPLAAGLAAAIIFAGSMGLSNLVISGAPIDAAFSLRGQQVQAELTSSDLSAARWLAVERPAGLVQSDFASQAILNIVGYANRRQYVPSVDPVLVDNRSWVLASRNDVVVGRAFGGSTTYQALFRFPLRFFTSTRSTLFVSNGAIVIGSTPARSR